MTPTEESPSTAPIQRAPKGSVIADIALMRHPNCKIETSDRFRSAEQLAPDVWIYPREDDLDAKIISACDPQGWNVNRFGPPMNTLYSIRRMPVPPHLDDWDIDDRLAIALALIHLVRPNSLGSAYSARLIGKASSDDFALYPGPVRRFGANAFVANPNENFIRPSDVPAIREIIAAYDRAPIAHSSVVQKAFWHFDFLAQVELVEIRWLLLCTGLEILLSEGDNPTYYFKARLPKLAKLVGVSDFTEAEANRLWGLRSGLSHGSKFGGTSSDEMDLYRKAEHVLRRSLVKGVTDIGFRAEIDTADGRFALFDVPRANPRRYNCAECGHVGELGNPLRR